MHPIAAGVVKSIIEVADVDGVVRKVDVNDVVERIDVDHVVERIDLNKVLRRIDWDEHLANIDFNAVVKRIDTNAILARGSTGVFTTLLDTLRFQVVMIDLYLRVVFRCRFWRQRDRQRVYLPPKPTGPRQRQRHDQHLYPRGKSNKVVAVQGRYCGFVSKALAILLDIFTLTLLFAMFFGMIRWALVLFLGVTHDEAVNKTKAFDRSSHDDDDDQADDERSSTTWIMLAVYCVHWFLYFFLTTALTGRTVGMAVVGLKVCNNNRKNPLATPTVGQAFVRTALLPLTLTLFPSLAVIGLVRRDGRMLHDLVPQTGIVYLWDAKQARIRHQALRKEQGSIMSSSDDDDDTNDLDDILEQEEADDTFVADTERNYQGQEVVLRNAGETIPLNNGRSS